MITITDIASSNPEELSVIKGNLVVEKMRLDKFFSNFLDQHELREDELETPEWQQYHSMYKEYETINALIASTEFYIRKHRDDRSYQRTRTASI